MLILLDHDTAGIETEGAQTFTESSVRYRERTREDEENRISINSI